MKIRTISPPVDFSAWPELLRVLIPEDTDEARIVLMKGSYSEQDDVVRVIESEPPGQVAGFVRYKRMEGFAHIMDVVVHPSQQGNGYVRLLMNDAAERCREEGFGKVMSRTFTDNRASIALHKACGYQEAFRKDDSIVWELFL